MAFRIIFLAGLILIHWSCNSADSTAEKSIDLSTKRAKFSYAIGYELGKSLENLKNDVDLETVTRGMGDYMSEAEPLLPTEEMQSVKTEELARLREEFRRREEEKSQARREEGEAFLAANKSKEGVITTESGLQYMVLEEGSGPKPTLEDRVKVKYRGTFIDGQEFDSTDRRGGEPVTFRVKGVIAGWEEGLQLMQVGSKYRFFVPADLAYGQSGQRPSIPPHATLIFEVELLEINPEE